MASKRGYGLKGIPAEYDFDKGDSVSLSFVDEFGSLRYTGGIVVGYDFRIRPEIVVKCDSRGDFPGTRVTVPIDWIRSTEKIEA